MERYRVEAGSLAGTPYGGDETVYLFTVLLALGIGVVLVAMAWQGRQLWLLGGSAGLVVASVVYLAWAVVG